MTKNEKEALKPVLVKRFEKILSDAINDHCLKFSVDFEWDFRNNPCFKITKSIIQVDEVTKDDRE